MTRLYREMPWEAAIRSEVLDQAAAISRAARAPPAVAEDFVVGSRMAARAARRAQLRSQRDSVGGEDGAFASTSPAPTMIFSARQTSPSSEHRPREIDRRASSCEARQSSPPRVAGSSPRRERHVLRARQLPQHDFRPTKRVQSPQPQPNLAQQPQQHQSQSQAEEKQQQQQQQQQVQPHQKSQAQSQHLPPQPHPHQHEQQPKPLQQQEVPSVVPSSRPLSPPPIRQRSKGTARPVRRSVVVDGTGTEPSLKNSNQLRRRSSPNLLEHRAEDGVELGCDSDPMGLRRFTEAQRLSYPRALREIRAGKKSSCWMWFVIPTPPHIVNGVERGSFLNRKYALRSDAEVQAYLDFKADGVDLRENYFEIMQAVRDQLRAGKKAVSLVGHFDEPKLMSSVNCFQRIACQIRDSELEAVLTEILELLKGGA